MGHRKNFQGPQCHKDATDDDDSDDGQIIVRCKDDIVSLAYWTAFLDYTGPDLL